MASKIHLTLPSGQKMPALGLGTFETKDEAEMERTIDVALEKGYRHFDSAWAYENEAVLGKALKKWLSSGKLKREDLFITTKLPMHGIHPDRVEIFLKKSLAKLQLDYVDLYLIHFPVGCKCVEETLTPVTDDKGDLVPEPKTDHVALWKKMEEQVDAGRAKNIGLSNYNIKQIETVLQSARIKPANLQVEVHIFFQQQKLIDFCHKKGITVTAYSPFGCLEYNKLLIRMGKEPQELPDIVGNKVTKKIGEKYKKTAAQVALRFLLQKGIAAIPKSVIPEQMEENISIFDFTLTQDEMKTIEGLDGGQKAKVCKFDLFGPNVMNHPEFPFEK